MIKIYDEIQYIEDFVKGDFLDTPHWIYDISIYVRWKYKDCHNEYTKAKIRDELVKKCQKSFPWFNINIHYKIIDEVIKNNWKETRDFLSIKEIPIRQEVIEWFQKQNLKKNELKLLFTIYIAYRIKKCRGDFSEQQCLDFYHLSDKTFLRKNGCLSTSTSLRKTLISFYDRGYLYSENGNKYTPIFIRDNDVFKLDTSEVSNRENILITKDLETCGEWIFNRLKNYTYCIQCGRMIEKITNPNKYCDECRKKIEESKKPKMIKKIICQDCGKEFVVSAKNNSSIRCEDCQKKYEYTTIEEKVTCKKCGKEFIKNGNSKTRFCKECYKKYNQLSKNIWRSLPKFKEQPTENILNLLNHVYCLKDDKYIIFTMEDVENLLSFLNGNKSNDFVIRKLNKFLQMNLICEDDKKCELNYELFYELLHYCNIYTNNTIKINKWIEPINDNTYCFFTDYNKTLIDDCYMVGDIKILDSEMNAIIYLYSETNPKIIEQRTQLKNRNNKMIDIDLSSYKKTYDDKKRIFTFSKTSIRFKNNDFERVGNFNDIDNVNGIGFSGPTILIRKIDKNIDEKFCDESSHSFPIQDFEFIK